MRANPMNLEAQLWPAEYATAGADCRCKGLCHLGACRLNEG
jgi:hypothetical protein